MLTLYKMGKILATSNQQKNQPFPGSDFLWIKEPLKYRYQ
jgi:hypothetical protein